MSRLASPTDVWHSRFLLTGGLALALIVLPAGTGTDGPLLDWQTALAKGPGDGPGGGRGGHGGGKGNGRGGGLGEHGRGLGKNGLDDGWAHGRGRGPGGPGETARGPHDLNEFFDGVRSGKAFGMERRDERVSAAKERYREALGRPGPGRDQAEGARAMAYGFSFEESTALVERGWKGPARQDGFRNHGQRTRTMVELAKQLGYGARVGALQANFGTPFENGIADLQAELEAARAAGDDAEVQRLEDELATAIAEAKPGMGPDDSWATADLDVNDDQVVDGRDLEALAQGGDADQDEVAQQGS